MEEDKAGLINSITFRYMMLMAHGEGPSSWAEVTFRVVGTQAVLATLLNILTITHIPHLNAWHIRIIVNCYISF